MTENSKNDIRSKRRPRLNISEAVELLVVITLGFSFYQLSLSESFIQFLVNVFVSSSVLNFWLTTRVSFAVYTSRVFLVDIFSIAILFGMVVQAGSPNDVAYPPAVFWLLVAGLEASYAVWDVLLAREATEASAKKTFKIWTALSTLAVIGCVGAFATEMRYIFIDAPSWLAPSVGFSSLAYIFVMNVVWNFQLFAANKNQNETDLI